MHHRIQTKWLVPIVGLLLTSVTEPLLAENFSEHEVQAVLMYNVTKFVKWPESAFATQNEPLRICILGDDPINSSLKLLRDKPVHGHTILLHTLTGRLRAEDQCHVLFVGSSEKDHLQDILRPIRNEPVLTIANFNGFARNGGVLSLVRRDKRVKISINTQVSEQAGLSVNSQLLELATVVASPQGEG
jgi:hypothetical protein